MSIDLITILGPTATGKTNIAVKLAVDFNGEIISADSRQVYIGMDIGTGKDLDEFRKSKISYHLIDITDPNEEYNLFRFSKDFYTAFEQIKSNGKMPILVGGTGLYLSAVLQSYHLAAVANKNIDELNALNSEELRELLIKLKPKLHNVTDLKSKNRLVQAVLVELARNKSATELPQLNSLTIGTKQSREETKKRITQRLKNRLAEGMIEEVEALMSKGVSKDKLDFFGLEYRFVSQYIHGKLNYNDMFQKLNSAIHNFAKRQMTWFRKMEREGVEINWFPPESYSQIKDFIDIRLGNDKKTST